MRIFLLSIVAGSAAIALPTAAAAQSSATPSFPPSAYFPMPSVHVFEDSSRLECSQKVLRSNIRCVSMNFGSRLYAIGDTIPASDARLTPYERLPRVVRTRLGLVPDFDYIYRDGILYTLRREDREVLNVLRLVSP